MTKKQKRVLCAPIKVLKRDKVMNTIAIFDEMYFIEKAMEANVELTDAFREKTRKAAINSFRDKWPKNEWHRLDAVKNIPVADMGIELYDTTTLLHQRIDEYDTFVSSAYDSRKMPNELLMGDDNIVIEMGSAGICYCDSTEIDSKSNLLSISGKDIVGEVSAATLKFWRKSKASNSKKNAAGEEFSFSHVSESCSNILKCHTWIENGDLIFQILTVFYTEGEVGNEKRYIDLQVNVFIDTLTIDEVKETLTKKFGVIPLPIANLLGDEELCLIQEDGKMGFIFNDSRDVELDDDGWPITEGEKVIASTKRRVPKFIKKPAGVKNMERVCDGENVIYIKDGKPYYKNGKKVV